MKIAAARSDAADEDRIELRSKLADADQEVESLKRQITGRGWKLSWDFQVESTVRILVLIL